MKKKELIRNWIRDWWRCTLILLLVSIGSVLCGYCTTARIMEQQVYQDWNQHTVLTDYNDIAGSVKG